MERNSEGAIRNALSFVNPDCDRDTWIRIGLALHHWDPRAGLRLWDEWSKRAPQRYPGSQRLAREWAGMRPGTVTTGTLIHLARQAGWRPDAHVEPSQTAGVVSVQPASNTAPEADAAPEPPARDYPPASEVHGLWRACRPVYADRECTAYLESRKLDPAAITDLDLARALPNAAPAWARHWPSTGHRLIVPLFDACGRLTSVRARCVRKTAHKVLSPTGHRSAGLVMADPLASLMLAGAGLGDDTTAAELVGKVGLWIAEGDMDFCTLATRTGESNEDAPAVIGIFGGAWKEAHAARVPTGTVVTICPDPDNPGARYAEVIARTLRGRCKINVVRGWKASA